MQRGKPFTKNDPRINKDGRPRKTGIAEALESRKGTMTMPDGSVVPISGEEILAKEFVNRAIDSRDPMLIRQALIMAQREQKEAQKADSNEQELKERRLKAAAEKIEIENDIRQKRFDLRTQKEEVELSIKKSKAEQEELKTKRLLGDSVDVETMRYYISFFQRGITDCFASLKKISKDIKRLYISGNDREAERKLQEELHVCFANVIKNLEDTMREDLKT
jgi:hypothetical protein